MEKGRKEPSQKMLTVVRAVYRHGGGASIPIPMEFLKMLEWPPSKTKVLISILPNGKALSIEKLREKGD